MATYTDLMILLLTFFVLLLSLASLDKRRKRLAINSLVGAFGFKPGAHSILGKEKGLNITAGSAPLVPEEIQFERLRNLALRHGMESDMSISKQLDRTVLTFNRRVLFDRGSDQLNPDIKKFLLDLSGVLRDESHLIELRGYADAVETSFQPESFKYTVLLSSKRAMAVFDFLREEGGIPAKTMVAHGFGLNSEEVKYTGKKHYLDRQVEIILDDREKVPYRLKKSERPISRLDFKGFFFRTASDVYGK